VCVECILIYKILVYYVCREDLLARQLRAKLAAARKYASSLLTNWDLGHCSEAVQVFCSQDDAMVGTAAGSCSCHRYLLLLIHDNYMVSIFSREMEFSVG